MTYQIRHIEPGDAEAVHRILTSPHVVDGTMRLPVAALAATEQRIANEDGMYKLVAVSDGSVVGFSELITHPRFPRHSHAGDINMIVSSAEMQGRGVGRALMQHMVELADQWLGLVRLGLIVWANNERAIKLYEQFGFETEGVMRSYALWKGEYLDAVVMGRVKI